MCAGLKSKKKYHPVFMCEGISPKSRGVVALLAAIYSPPYDVLSKHDAIYITLLSYDLQFSMKMT